MKTQIVVGIDIGSLSAKVVVMDSKKRILSSEVVQRGIIVDEAAAKQCLITAMSKAGITPDDVDYSVSTGYGRALPGFGDKNVTEISCHARGAHFLNPEVRTIIDIGGQDSKVIALEDSGIVHNFVMNDKCAAGTGRFIEVMSAALGIPLKDAGALSLQSQNQAKVSSTCVVFAESEVISLVAKGMKKIDILAGIHHAIAERVSGLSKLAGVRPAVFMSGGVAKNKGVVYHLERAIGEKIFVPEDPQIVGAIGAALYALDVILE